MDTLQAESHGPPAVAVVMPTLNQARYLEEAIASVMDQAVPGLVLRVQDGGSNDGTMALLSSLAARHPGLQWVSAADGGPAQALNIGFSWALSTGAPVIGWLNSDDLYTPGAIARALGALAAQPDAVAVYGEGEHIDASGKVLGRYPTLRPQVPVARWRDACPVCQPTMWLRRGALQALLPLDEGLQTAFDFELWLRLFKTWPGCVGFVDAVQARSRLHEGAITRRLRERVALEGMQVVHRHLGAAPGHWLLTHVAEAATAVPFEQDAQTVRLHLLALAERAAAWMAPGEMKLLQQQMRACAAWRLMHEQLAADVTVDGWAGPELQLRLRQSAPPEPPITAVRLRGRMAWPRPWRWRLRLQAWHEGQPVASTDVWWRRPFELSLPVATQEAGARLVFDLRADGSFVPAKMIQGSPDTRELSVVIDSVEPLASPRRT